MEHSNLYLPIKDFQNLSYEIKDFIAVFPNFFSNEYCDFIVQKFESIIQSGFGYKNCANIQRSDSVLFSYDTIDMYHLGDDYKQFVDTFWQTAYAAYAKEYGVIVTADTQSIFSCKIQKTKLGEGFHNWHFDNASKLVCNRFLVFILYLNDVDDGGETEFLYYSRRVKPQKGTLLVFPSSLTHTHRGNPPLTNSKYILTGWVEF